MAQHSTVPRSSFSPLKQLGFEGCLLCCALYSCFGVFYGLNSLLLQLIACCRQAASYGLYIEVAWSYRCLCFLCARLRSPLLDTYHHQSILPVKDVRMKAKVQQYWIELPSASMAKPSLA